MEGGLDEDWGQDVDVIELQNRLPEAAVKSTKGDKQAAKKERTAAKRSALEAPLSPPESVEL